MNDNIHILGLSETNLNSKEGKWLNQTLHTLDYTAYWSTKDKKIKGSGVAIIMHNKWAKHVGKIRILGPYLIDVTLYFKGVTINVIQIYSPNNDTVNNNKIKDYLSYSIRAHDPNNQQVIMGDFNSVCNSSLDRSNSHSSAQHKKPSELIQLL